MKTSFKLLLLVLLLESTGFAQNQSGAIWVWSDYCGLDFRDTSNVVPYYGMTFSNPSGSSSISSTDGQLLFTSDTKRIKDRYNQYILNWDSIGTITGVNRAIFFRSTIDTSLVHYFNLRGPINPYWVRIKDTYPISYQIDSSIIEVSNFFSSSYPYSVNYGVRSLMVDAVQHGNGRDWWIVAKLNQSFAGGNDSFVVFSLYNDSIFISNYQEVGPRLTGSFELDISNDGDKICLMQNDTFKIYEYDFDRCSGIISNPVEIYNEHTWRNSLNQPLGLSYSRSSNFIYANINNQSLSGCTDTIYQINPRTTIDSLKATIIWYDTANVIGDSAHIYNIKLANDGNIYFNYSKGFSSATGNQPILSYIGVIKNADMPYPYCTVEPLGVYLGVQCQANVSNLFPSIPNYNLGPMIGSPCDTLNITSTGQWLSPAAQVKVYPNPANDKINITWLVQGGYTWALKSLAGSTLSFGTQLAGNATISTAHLPEGMYFLELHSAKEHKVEKVIVVR